MTNITRPTEEAYDEMQKAYDFYNEQLFDNSLPPCLLTFQRSKRTYGYFSRGRFIKRDGQRADEIAMNPEYFAVLPLIVVLQTLVHEMAHCWQHAFGQPTRNRYHNREWAAKMEAIGLMPSHTGEPGGRKVGQQMDDYCIPGGSFALTTQKLLETGFAITWLDRYPAPPPSRFRPSPSSNPNPDPADGNMESIKGNELGVASPGRPDALSPPVLLHPGLVEAVNHGNRSLRARYMCPTCLVKVWGKPTLNIICGDCSIRLVAHRSGMVRADPL